MGLGKTIETIDLILINPRPQESKPEKDELPDRHTIRPSKATIIITPPTICNFKLPYFANILKYHNGKESLLRRHHP